MQWNDFNLASLENMATLDWSFTTSLLWAWTIAGAPSVVTLTSYLQSTLNIWRVFSMLENKSFLVFVPDIGSMSKSSLLTLRVSSTPRINIANCSIINSCTLIHCYRECHKCFNFVTQCVFQFLNHIFNTLGNSICGKTMFENACLLLLRTYSFWCTHKTIF